MSLRVLSMILLALLTLRTLIAGTVVTFEGVPDSAPVRDFYHSLGVDFVKATAITTGVSLNEFEFPPHSGTNAVFDNTGSITVNFVSPVCSVGASFTYAVPITLRAFNSSGVLVGSKMSTFANNELLSGDSGSSPNEFLQLTFAGGISRLTIAGVASGSSFSMDDLTFQTLCDTVPPVTRATPSPGPNAKGWNNTTVIVTLKSADDEPGGTGVKDIHFSLTGAQNGTSVVLGSTASVNITAEGTTSLTYFAIDNAGNQETPKTLTLNIDETPPVFSGLPALGCTIWPPNHKFVQVADVKASDALSGLATGSLKLTGVSNEASDPTDPDIVITPDGSGGLAVQLRVDRLGTGNGRIYALTATAADLAGNVATATAECVVPHDQRN